LNKIQTKNARHFNRKKRNPLFWSRFNHLLLVHHKAFHHFSFRLKSFFIASHYLFISNQRLILNEKSNLNICIIIFIFSIDTTFSLSWIMPRIYNEKLKTCFFIFFIIKSKMLILFSFLLSINKVQHNFLFWKPDLNQEILRYCSKGG
jgi:hypothetical protein